MFRDETPRLLERAGHSKCSARPADVLENPDRLLPLDDGFEDFHRKTVLRRKATFSSLETSINLHSVEILTQHLFDQIVISETWLSLLPGLYSRSNDKSPLKYSIHAASLFLMANQIGDYAAMARARRAYGRCLSLLSIRLNNRAEQLEDESLCTMLLLHFINVSQ